MPLVADALCLSESTFCLVTQAQAGQSNCAEKLKIEMNRHTMTIIIKLNTLLKENGESWVKCKKKKYDSHFVENSWILYSCLCSLGV